MATFNETVPDQMSFNEALPNVALFSNTQVEDTQFPSTFEGLTFIPLALTDDLGIDDPLADNVWFAIFETEAHTINDDPTVIKFVDIVLEDGTSLADEALGNAVFNLLMTEGIAFRVILNVAGHEFVCWVANADTFAHSQYDQFDFDSMCRIGTRYYGAKRDGIYQLDGETDEGAEIPWFLSLPQTDSGTALFKRVPRVYMGIKNAGAFYIRTITDGGKEHVYLFNRQSPSTAGVGEKLGRGVKSRYWGYDLVGIDGADFELDQIEFFPVVLGRRVL